MKMLTVIILIGLVVSCQNRQYSCDEKPHQSKCPGHQYHGHE